MMTHSPHHQVKTLGAKEFLFTALAIAVGVVAAGAIQTYVLPMLNKGTGQ